MNRTSYLLVVTTGATGIAASVVGLVLLPWSRAGAVAVLLAVALVTELVQVAGDDDATDPADAATFSFSSGIHLAAVLLVGGPAAALIAFTAVVIADGLRGDRFLRVAYNASAFAVAAAGSGLAYSALGGRLDRFDLRREGLAILAAALVYETINTLLVNGIVAATRRISLASIALETLSKELPTMAAEMALGIAVAQFASTDPVALVTLVPLAFAVYLSHARLTATRRDTARALETFANVVDERDPSTHAHSERVATYVAELAEALGLPASTVARIRWAGRLHDLGKVGVDTSILRKQAKLEQDDWLAIRRHARVSARLLRNFRFAAAEARAVEYHHERYDGSGYYGIAPAEIPLASHFLIVADSFDAMTSDRPYRRGLSRERALEEIERNLGSQFHPLVGKAFVALQRGLDPVEILSRAELAELRALARTRRRAGGIDRGNVPKREELLVLVGVVLALVLVLTPYPLAAVAGLAMTAAGAAGILLRRRRAARLLRDLGRVAEKAGAPAFVLPVLAARLAAEGISWLVVFSWRRDLVTGTTVAEWGETEEIPSTAALTSWLVREADGGERLLMVRGADLGTTGSVYAAPIDDAEFLVLGGDRIRGHVAGVVPDITQQLARQFVRTHEAPPVLAAVG